MIQAGLAGLWRQLKKELNDVSLATIEDVDFTALRELRNACAKKRNFPGIVSTKLSKVILRLMDEIGMELYAHNFYACLNSPEHLLVSATQFLRPNHQFSDNHEYNYAQALLFIDSVDHNDYSESLSNSLKGLRYFCKAFDESTRVSLTETIISTLSNSNSLPFLLAPPVRDDIQICFPSDNEFRISQTIDCDCLLEQLNVCGAVIVERKQNPLSNRPQPVNQYYVYKDVETNKIIAADDETRWWFGSIPAELPTLHILQNC